MFGLKFARSLVETIELIKKNVQRLMVSAETQSTQLQALQTRLEFVERQTEALTVSVGPSLNAACARLSSNLDIAINEIEFVRRRAVAHIDQGAALVYLADQSPIFIDPRDPGVAGAVLNGGLYEPENVDVILSFVRPDTVFLDIGANVGIFSLLVGRRVRAQGKVHAFEPQTHLAELLKRSAFLNGLGSLEGAGVIETHSVGVRTGIRTRASRFRWDISAVAASSPKSRPIR